MNYLEKLKKQWRSDREYSPAEISCITGNHIVTVRLWYKIGLQNRSKTKRVVLETFVTGRHIFATGDEIIKFFMELNT